MADGLWQIYLGSQIEPFKPSEERIKYYQDLLEKVRFGAYELQYEQKSPGSEDDPSPPGILK